MMLRNYSEQMRTVTTLQLLVILSPLMAMIQVEIINLLMTILYRLQIDEMVTCLMWLSIILRISEHMTTQVIQRWLILI